jgi:hypothetical protein
MEPWGAVFISSDVLSHEHCDVMKTGSISASAILIRIHDNYC